MMPFGQFSPSNRTHSGTYSITFYIDRHSHRIHLCSTSPRYPPAPPCSPSSARPQFPSMQASDRETSCNGPPWLFFSPHELAVAASTSFEAAARSSSMETRARLMNTTPWWGSGNIHQSDSDRKSLDEIEASRREQQEDADTTACMRKVWAVLDRRAAIHALAIHLSHDGELDGGEKARECSAIRKVQPCACGRPYIGFDVLPQVKDGKGGEGSTRGVKGWAMGEGALSSTLF